MSAPNRSLQEKSSARLAAAQLLYQAAMSGEAIGAAQLLDTYQRFVEANREAPKEAGLPPVSASLPYLKKLLEGVIQHAGALEPWVAKACTADWKKERISPLLLAILRLAIFELAHHTQLKTPVIINEYVNLTGRFFNEAETGFVNAALHNLAVELRGQA